MFGVRAALRIFVNPARLFRRGVALGAPQQVRGRYLRYGLSYRGVEGMLAADWEAPPSVVEVSTSDPDVSIND